MPKNCSADVEAVVAFFDKTFTGDNQTAIDDLKALYGLQNLTHLDDVAGACTLWLSPLLPFCLEVVTDGHFLSTVTVGMMYGTSK